MSLKEMLKQMVNDYFVVVTGVLFCQTLFCVLFIPDAVISVRDLGYILISGIIFLLPDLLLVSTKELSKKQWWIRLVLQFAVLEATVIGSGHWLFGWLKNWNVLQHVVMVILIFVVYMTVIVVNWKRDQSTANSINKKLQSLGAEEE